MRITEEDELTCRLFLFGFRLLSGPSALFETFGHRSYHATSVMRHRWTAVFDACGSNAHMISGTPITLALASSSTSKRALGFFASALRIVPHHGVSH